MHFFFKSKISFFIIIFIDFVMVMSNIAKLLRSDVPGKSYEFFSKYKGIFLNQNLKFVLRFGRRF